MICNCQSVSLSTIPLDTSSISSPVLHVPCRSEAHAQVHPRSSFQWVWRSRPPSTVDTPHWNWASCQGLSRQTVVVTSKKNTISRLFIETAFLQIWSDKGLFHKKDQANFSDITYAYETLPLCKASCFWIPLSSPVSRVVLKAGTSYAEPYRLNKRNH